MKRTERWFLLLRAWLLCSLAGAPLALAGGGAFQLIAANPHGPPPNGLLNSALLKGRPGGSPPGGPKKSGKRTTVGIVVVVIVAVLFVLACVWMVNN